MPCDDPHCPFLNRDDARCAEQFNVSHLKHTFGYCFNNYKACPTYLEMLVERRVKRVQAAHVTTNPNLIQVSIRRTPRQDTVGAAA